MVDPGNRAVKIGFLVERKFPPLILATMPAGSNKVGSGADTIGRIRRHDEIALYRVKLEKLPSEELETLFTIETQKLEEDERRKEDLRFYNLPSSAADFDHWSKVQYWSLEEAVALALGKAPETVSWGKIQGNADGSSFVQRYKRLRQLVDRAKHGKALSDSVAPPNFIRWADDNEIEIPAPLREKVARLKGVAVDWKQSYEELQLTYERDIANCTKTLNEQTEAMRSMLNKVAEVQAELSNLKAAPNAKPTRSQSTVERENMLKVIHGMALGGYGYQQDDKRSPVIKEIVRDLELRGVKLSDDTVRRYLNEANKLWPSWQEDSRS